MRTSIQWLSHPMQIGKHLWRVGVGEYDIRSPDNLTRCTFYQYSRDGMDWKEAREWPSYDSNDTYNGLPLSLDRLYKRERRALDTALDRQPRMELDLQGSLFA